MRTKPIKDYICQHCGFQKATSIIEGAYRMPYGATCPGYEYHPIGQWDEGPQDITVEYICALCDFCREKTEPLLKLVDTGDLYRILTVFTSKGLIDLPPAKVLGAGGEEE